jgi:ferritin-like metal-binding protein YciE
MCAAARNARNLHQPGAEKLGLREAVPLLRETLEEEKNTDEALTDLAETAVNQYAEAAE